MKVIELLRNGFDMFLSCFECFRVYGIDLVTTWAKVGPRAEG